MMHPGFMVGIIIAITLVVVGVVGLISAKQINIKSKWGMWLILAGIIALVSAAVNYSLFR